MKPLDNDELDAVTGGRNRAVFGGLGYGGRFGGYGYGNAAMMQASMMPFWLQTATLNKPSIDPTTLACCFLLASQKNQNA